MYAILISIALGIYTTILVDFSFLYKDMAQNNALLHSAQAFYTAEGAVEVTAGLLGKQKVRDRNPTFLSFSQGASTESDDEFLTYNEGIDSVYKNRHLSLSEANLDQASKGVVSNFETDSFLHLSEGQGFDGKAFYGLEPISSKSFVLREVRAENNFNALTFDYNTHQDDSRIFFEVIAFPKDQTDFGFKDFNTLKNNPQSDPVKRLVINTADESFQGFAFEGGLPLTVSFPDSDQPYKKSVSISGFQPLTYNYILHFQTLDNKPIHFKLSAYHQGKSVVMPTVNQTIDVIGVTPEGLYQRLKFQRQAEEGLAPGYDFVHFSDQSIIK